MRILVIEDNVELARQIKSELERALYVVKIAYDGEDGQYLVQSESFDAIILDLGIPKRDGLEVLEQWRADGKELYYLTLDRRLMAVEASLDDGVEIGVPQHEVPLALLTFNVGVETGQLLFIAVVLSLIALLKRLPLSAPQGSWRLLPYSIGGVAAFWTIDRVMSFLPGTA